MQSGCSQGCILGLSKQITTEVNWRRSWCCREVVAGGVVGPVVNVSAHREDSWRKVGWRERREGPGRDGTSLDGQTQAGSQFEMRSCIPRRQVRGERRVLWASEVEKGGDDGEGSYSNGQTDSSPNIVKLSTTATYDEGACPTHARYWGHLALREVRRNLGSCGQLARGTNSTH